MHQHDPQPYKVEPDGKFIYSRCECGMIFGEPVSVEEASEVQALIRY